MAQLLVRVIHWLVQFDEGDAQGEPYPPRPK
jgi:hypothetical protein